MTSTDTREPLPSEQGEDGSFRRKDARFRDFVTADGGSGYKAEPGRYHLYVSSACPWAHRTMIYRHLKGLEDAISMTVVDPERDERGWAITEAHGTTPDHVNGFTFVSEAYILSDTDFDGHVTVPVLWDRERGRIVNNESSEIIRMLESEFDAFAKHPERHYLPEELRSEIDELNEFVYENVRRVIDYPQLSGYLRDLYQHPGIAQTVDMDHIKRHYYRTHPTLNPRRIVPVGPALDLAAPHGRDHLAASR
jgi:putative glutathione S-transferase